MMNKAVMVVLVTLTLVGVCPEHIADIETTRTYERIERSEKYQDHEKAVEIPSRQNANNRTIIMEATAYILENGNGDGVTATGTIPVSGKTVAVDPRVIPYGTRMIINGVPGYVAEDTGGAIRGNRIDIFMNSYRGAIQFGRQTVKVEIEY